MDFYEIMDHCGFDMEKADAMAKQRADCPDWINEALKEIGLEKIQPESV